ncbi:hypothetical protein CsatA_015142 [Cannabis sativa]
MNIFYTSHKTILFHLAYWTRLEDHVFYYTSGFCTFNWCKESLTIFFVLLSQFGCQMWDPLKRNELNGYQQRMVDSNPGQLWLLPYHLDEHWMLIIIDFDHQICYYLDSLANLPPDAIKSLISR